MNVNFFMPTKVIMGENCIGNNKELLKEYGQTALIITGMNSAKRSGSLQDITEALDAIGIAYFVYDRVMENPTVACVYEGASIAKQKKVDFIIGIGGGSPMDAAKAIALLAVQEIPEEDLFLNKFGKDALPVVMIPTTAGTGSEVTANSILTSDILQTKRSISTPILFPKLAFLDVRYTKTLPMRITVNTALDALSHAVEGMLSVRSTEFSNYIAVESIKRITQCLRYLSPEHDSEPAKLTTDIREKLLYGSMLAGMVIAHTGTCAVHAMGYLLTYYKNIDHGRANALLLPSFLRFTSRNDINTTAKILSAMELKTVDEFEAVFLRLIDDREEITVKELERFTEASVKAKSITNSKIIPEKEDIYNIYFRSLHISDILN